MSETYEDIKRRHTSLPGEAAQPNGGAADDLLCTAAIPHEIFEIPPRRWAYGRYLLFGEAAALGAIDGGGKGAHAVAIMLSIISGQELLGERIWRTGPVAIITFEDTEIEWRRRIAAACLHFGLDYKTIISSVYFIRHSSRRVRIATRTDGRVIFPDGDEIIACLKRIAASLLIVDPLNHAHELEDGNSNALMAQVAGELTRIAHESDTAVLVLHHLRKGGGGNADDFMGATSLRATFRAVRILSRMSAEEAEKLNVPTKEAWRHSRISGSKENYAPPPDLATWYRLESVELGNKSDAYPDGDSVQVATRWTPPSAFEGLSLPDLAAILAEFRKGPGAGEFYSPDRRAKRWAGDVIVKQAHKSADDATRILKTWLKTEVVTKGEYESPERREKVGRIEVNEVKAAEILGPLYTTTDTGK